MKVVFIAGPYRADSIYKMTQNIEAARTEALKWWAKGYAVICPHSNTALMDGALPDKVWLDGALELLRRSDVVVVIGYWGESAGAIKEHELAVKLGKEIIEAR